MSIDLQQLFNQALELARHYVMLAVVIALGILYYAVKNPREFFKLLTVLVVLGVVLYFLGLFAQTTTTGISDENRGIEKSTRGLDD